VFSGADREVVQSENVIDAEGARQTRMFRQRHRVENRGDRIAVERRHTTVW
jgi:hypothetical protein